MKGNVAFVLGIVVISLFLFFVGSLVIPSLAGMAGNFSDHPTIAIYEGERYHVLPESKLTETLVIMDEQGEKYYVISEEKLRLLGPKLLTGGE